MANRTLLHAPPHAADHAEHAAHAEHAGQAARARKHDDHEKPSAFASLLAAHQTQSEKSLAVNTQHTPPEPHAAAHAGATKNTPAKDAKEAEKAPESTQAAPKKDAPPATVVVSKDASDVKAAAVTPVAGAAAPRISAAPHAPPPAAAPVVRAAAEDASLFASIHAHDARVSLDAGDAGRLSMHLRVKDGVADVRASGPAAALVEGRVPELRAALAGQGLSLGDFGSGNASSGARDETDKPQPPLPRPVVATSSKAEREPGIHVEA